MKLKIWDKTETIYLADGSPCTPEEVMDKWKFARHFPALMEVSGGMTLGFSSLAVVAANFGIDDSLSDVDKLAAIQAAREQAQNATGGGAGTPEILATQESVNEVRELLLMNMQVSLELAGMIAAVSTPT